MVRAQRLCLLLITGCAASPLPQAASTPEASTVSQPPTAAANPPEQPLLPNAREPLPEVTTGGAPSVVQLQAAQRRGYRSVISLLPEAETTAEAAEAQRLGMQFVSIPIPDASALTRDNAERLASAMDVPGRKPLLLHCASGNRVGALLALRAFYVDHSSVEDALALGSSAGMTSLRSVVETQLAQASAAHAAP